MKFSGKYTFHIRRFVQGLVLLAILAAVLGPGLADPVENRALLRPLAARSLILDLANPGRQTIVAVGWRGHILISHDRGTSWAQIESPTRRMLTSVYFSDSLQGWAVGHGAVILRTEDGGRNWNLLSSAPEEERPLFDVIVSGNYGFAVGAYAKFMTTRDGGKTWEPGEINILRSEEEKKESPGHEEPLPFDFHLNAVAQSADGVFYIAAEAGYLFRSDDGGHTWRELPSPYEGSFFGVLPLDGDSLLAYGLRGHVFRSKDGGQNWKQIPTGTTALLTDAVRMPDNTVIITGMAGVILVSSDQGESFTLEQPDRISLTSVVRTESGTLVIAGERGSRVYHPVNTAK